MFKAEISLTFLAPNRRSILRQSERYEPHLQKLRERVKG